MSTNINKQGKKNPDYQCQKLQHLGASVVVQWLGICLPMQGTQVGLLVRELKSDIPWGN